MFKQFLQYRVVALTLVCIAGGAVIRFAWGSTQAKYTWTLALVLLGAPLVIRTIREGLRGHFATDVVASLSILASVALQQPLVGLVIVLMQSGGEALENYAQGRASDAVRAMESAAPQVAHVLRESVVEDVPVAQILVGDLLLVRPGDIVPCDGVVVLGESQLDTSSLTGEAMPVAARAGLAVLSGTRNGMGSFQLRATAVAARSQYATIVEMVRSAQAAKAPLQRLADRYAVWFTPFTLLVCATTYAFTRDWSRILAVLAVATPCPLILATPVAIMGGINRAAKRLILIKSGGALEKLSEVAVVVFDKTGTLTFGKPRVRSVRVAAGFSTDQLLRNAAAVEAHSSHLLARVIVQAAQEAGLIVPTSDSHVETAGDGIAGVVEGHQVRVGSSTYVLSQLPSEQAAMNLLRSTLPVLTAYVSVGDKVAGAVEFEDSVRPETPAVLQALRNMGLHRLLLLSGDDTPTVRAVALAVGINDSEGELKPADKARIIEQERATGVAVMMIGDGINDALALSVADVGVAMAASGGSISSEAADVVILADTLDRVPELLAIARRTKRVALESIWVGLGLSAIGMVFAALGALPPIGGAVVQEVVDVAVILNALRSSVGPRTFLVRA